MFLTINNGIVIRELYAPEIHGERKAVFKIYDEEGKFNGFRAKTEDGNEFDATPNDYLAYWKYFNPPKPPKRHKKIEDSEPRRESE